MAALVQQDSTVSQDWSAGAGGVAKSLAVAATVGNLIDIFVDIGNASRTVVSITESGGSTTYALKNRIQGDAGTFEIWYGIAAGASPGTGITITLSGNTGDGGAVHITEWSGLATDQSASVSNSSTQSSATAHNSGSVTPPNATGVVAYGSSHTPGTWTYDSAFTYVAGSQAANRPYGYLLNTGGAQEANNTSDDPEVSTMLIWAWAGASAPAAASRLMLLGVG